MSMQDPTTDPNLSSPPPPTLFSLCFSAILSRPADPSNLLHLASLSSALSLSPAQASALDSKLLACFPRLLERCDRAVLRAALGPRFDALRSDYAARREAVEGFRRSVTSGRPLPRRSSGYEGRHVSGCEALPLAALQRGVEYPGNLDVRNREKYLSEREFRATFGMGKGEFGELNRYRRIEMKKAVGLF
jgi:hypothetical protein